jgi:hypothetical protein
MPTSVSYRIVAVSPEVGRVVIDDSLELGRAEQMRDLLVKLKKYQEVVVEPDVDDGTPTVEIQRGESQDTLPI